MPLPPGAGGEGTDERDARRVRRGLVLAVCLLVALPALVLAAIAVAVTVALHRLGPPPLETAEPVSTLALDRQGRLLRAFATPEGRWRLPVDSARVDPGYRAMLIAYEDKRFHSHRGVDPLAVARALWQAATQGRVVSGASTLTMQVARLVEPREGRTVAAKLREMLRALQIEARLSKSEILDLYLRLAPFGGNLEGARAASLAYFGKEPYRLAPHEAALLVALPQAPEARRPDRRPQAARRARDRVLERMAEAGVVSDVEAAAYKSRPSPTRRRAFPMLAPHLTQAEAARAPERRVHRLTIDRDMQAALERLAAERAPRLGPRHSVAIVALDNASGEVLAHVGSAGYLDEARAGQVDMTLAPRSPGSALKPFIYGLAFEGGFGHPETLIEDRPTRFGGYAPRNFEQDHKGTVTVREALQLSLNVPAVQALEAVGPARLLARLREAGARLALPGHEPPGLAIALGGVGIGLMDLAGLYAGLARQGEPPVPRHVQAEAAGAPARHRPPRLLGPVAAWYVGDILRGSPPPESAAGGAIAYKTGTSYGYRDAWAAGFDGRHTIAVWVGRPDGGASPGMTGLTAAAPLLFDAFARVAPTRAPLAAAPREALVASTAALPPPLRHFRGAAGGAGTPTAAAPGPRIAFPPDGARVELLPEGDRPEPLALKAEGGVLPLTWFVNGAPVPAEPRQRMTFWRPDGDGFAELTVMDARGRSDRARFRVDLAR